MIGENPHTIITDPGKSKYIADGFRMHISMLSNWELGQEQLQENWVYGARLVAAGCLGLVPEQDPGDIVFVGPVERECLIP